MLPRYLPLPSEKCPHLSKEISPILLTESGKRIRIAESAGSVPTVGYLCTKHPRIRNTLSLWKGQPGGGGDTPAAQGSGRVALLLEPRRGGADGRVGPLCEQGGGGQGRPVGRASAGDGCEGRSDHHPGRLSGGRGGCLSISPVVSEICAAEFCRNFAFLLSSTGTWYRYL